MSRGSIALLLYYVELGARSLRRNPALTVLMVAAIAFGVGASMTTLTVLHVLSADPLPGHSANLYHVQLEPRPAAGATPGEEPPRQLTRRDAEALLRAGHAERAALMTSGAAAIEPPAGRARFFVDARWTSAGFFAMFRVPFVAGGPWSAEDDARAAPSAVIARALADKLFGTTDVIGRGLRIGDHELRIVGVIADWRPAPRFYDLGDPFGAGEQLFVPFSTSRELKLRVTGQLDCWGGTAVPDPEAYDAPCDWIQLWVELASPVAATAYRDLLVRYSMDQRAAGRFQRAPEVRLRNVPAWLAFNQAVPRDVRLQTWIAFGFLLVCLINTIGLLLTKFIRRSAELGVRRALGASRGAIFVQLLIESGMIGATGAVAGLGLAWLGLWLVRQQPTPYAALARLDLPMLVTTFTLAIASSLLAGVLPAWRGCQVAPSIQLKSS